MSAAVIKSFFCVNPAKAQPRYSYGQAAAAAAAAAAGDGDDFSATNLSVARWNHHFPPPLA